MVVWHMQSDHFTLGRRDQLFVYVKMYMCVASTDSITPICWDTVQNQNLELTKDFRQWHFGSICRHNQLDCQAYMSIMTTQVQCLYRSCVNKLEPQSGECRETPHNISVDKQCLNTTVILKPFSACSIYLYYMVWQTSWTNQNELCLYWWCFCYMIVRHTTRYNNYTCSKSVFCWIQIAQ